MTHANLSNGKTYIRCTLKFNQIPEINSKICDTVINVAVIKQFTFIVVNGVEIFLCISMEQWDVNGQQTSITNTQQSYKRPSLHSN